MKKRRKIALLYMGAFTPNESQFTNAATSTAANLFQLQFLDALRSSFAPEPTVYSYFPIPSFPKSKCLFFPSRNIRLKSGLRVRTLWHLNLGPLKIITLGFSAAWATLWWGMRNLTTRHRFVICYNLNAPPAIFLIPICRLLGIKLVPFVGDIYVPGEVASDTLLRRLEYLAQKWLLPKMSGLIVCNSAIIKDFAPDQKHLLLEGGVSESLIRRFQKSHYKSDATFKVVFAGQLNELNGIMLLLGALEKLELPNLRVVICGRGKYTEAVVEAAQFDSRIKYLGEISHERVLEEYASADLLLNLRRTNYTSHKYVFPSKVIECLASGRPLLSTCTGHIESEFGRYVFLLREETPDALARAIKEITTIQPAIRNELGRRAQQYTLEHKTWEVHAKRLHAYLENLILDRAA